MNSNLEDEYGEVFPPPEFTDKYGDDYIVLDIYWITDDKLGVIWLNRLQNASSTSGKLQ